MKRLALYSFYNKSGLAGSFVYYYLKRLSEISDVAVIVNGSLKPESKSQLESQGYRVFCRENRGFDFGAWKEFLLSNDQAVYSHYDELILCNCSCYGPVYPFQRIFDEMDRRATSGGSTGIRGLRTGSTAYRRIYRAISS